MTFQKIPKEQWLKLSQEEKNYYTLEFQKSVEKRQRITIFITRAIAIFCIFALFWIGYVQLQAVRNYEVAVDKYGVEGYCYLCGELAFKRCECEYYKEMDYGNIRMPEPNYTQISNELANYNVQGCKPFDYFIDNKIDEISKKNLTFQVTG